MHHCQNTACAYNNITSRVDLNLVYTFQLTGIDGCSKYTEKYIMKDTRISYKIIMSRNLSLSIISFARSCYHSHSQKRSINVHTIGDHIPTHKKYTYGYQNAFLESQHQTLNFSIVIRFLIFLNLLIWQQIISIGIKNSL